MESKGQKFAGTDTEFSMLYSQNVKNVSYKFNVVHFTCNSCIAYSFIM